MIRRLDDGTMEVIESTQVIGNDDRATRWTYATIQYACGCEVRTRVHFTERTERDWLLRNLGAFYCPACDDTGSALDDRNWAFDQSDDPDYDGPAYERGWEQAH